MYFDHSTMTNDYDDDDEEILRGGGVHYVW